MTEELEKEVEEYLHNNYCCKGSYCGFNTECKEGVRIRCSEFDILKKHLINFGESRKERIIELEKENAQLKLKLDALEGQTPWKDIKDKSELIKENVELKEELKKWKDEWQEQVQKATDEGYARTLQTMQLNKAKQFIRDFLAVAIDYIDPIDKNYSLIAEAEQFLKDN